MKIIAHRGLLHGPDKSKENTIEAIHDCIYNKVFAEIDLWYYTIGSEWAIGHDIGTTKIPNIEEFLTKYGPYCIFHAKNVAAFSKLFQYTSKNIEFFFHNTDLCTLTYQRYIWLYPGTLPITEGSIVVLPEQASEEYNLEIEKKMTELTLFGICTKYPLEWKQKYEQSQIKKAVIYEI